MTFRGTPARSMFRTAVRRKSCGTRDIADDPARLLTADEVAKLLFLGRSKVYEMVASQELPVVKIGSVVRVPKRALEK